MSPIVRALDVGYGAVKFVVGHHPGQPVVCQKFPSLAPIASRTDLSAGSLRGRETVVVEVDGRKYEVGPDAECALPTYHTRVLNPHFSDTPEYLALARGALTLMRAPTIDKLILGLPVSNFAMKRASVEARLSGSLALGEGHAIHIRSVATLAQPVGGLIAYVVENNAGHWAKGQVNLVVDPGFFTYDYVVTNGLIPIENRSGSVNAGVSAVLQHVANAISERIGEPYDNLLAIEQSLASGRKLGLFGQEEPLERFVDPRALHPVEEAVLAMINKVGTGADFKNVVLVGGGANLYLPQLRRRLPRHNIHVVDAPEFANVRGFQYAGERLLANTSELVA